MAITNNKITKFLEFIIVSGLLCLSALAFAQEKPGMTAIDLLNLPSLSDPRLSPDGTSLVYTLGESDWEENERINHIWMKRLPDGEAFQLTFGKEGESSPRWSQDGRQIGFLTERDEDENNQIYLISTRGGEARALTNLDTSPTDLTWSPDGTAIYFLSDIPKTEEEKKREDLKDDVFAFDNNWKHRHLWKVTVADGSVEQLTAGNFTINSYSLASDGSKVVIHRAPSPLLDSGYDSEIFVLDLENNSWQKLTDNKQREGSGELSPDGSFVLFISGSNTNVDKNEFLKFSLVHLNAFVGFTRIHWNSFRFILNHLKDLLE